jgi:hypothetical protein
MASAACGRGLAATTSGAIAVHEITMAAPDIVCVEVRDQPVIKGALVTLTAPDSGPFNTWLSRMNPATGRSDRCSCWTWEDKSALSGPSANGVLESIGSNNGGRLWRHWRQHRYCSVS